MLHHHVKRFTIAKDGDDDASPTAASAAATVITMKTKS